MGIKGVFGDFGVKLKSTSWIWNLSTQLLPSHIYLYVYVNIYLNLRHSEAKEKW